jgi:hypothetical protein
MFATMASRSRYAVLVRSLKLSCAVMLTRSSGMCPSVRVLMLPAGVNEQKKLEEYQNRWYHKEKPGPVGQIVTKEFNVVIKTET